MLLPPPRAAAAGKSRRTPPPPPIVLLLRAAPKIDASRFLDAACGLGANVLAETAAKLHDAELFPDVVSLLTEAGIVEQSRQHNDQRRLAAGDRLVLALLHGSGRPDLAPRDFSAVLGAGAPSKMAANMAFQDLMVWAVLMNHYRLSEYFWLEGGHSIPNALFASRL